MAPTPSKRPRRSASIGSNESTSSRSRPQQRPRSGHSPLHHILPAPIPSGHGHAAYQAYGPPPGVAGPSGWQANWPPREREREYNQRRSIDARSRSSGSSPRLEGMGETDEMGGLVFARDAGSRAPRSMMACTRCRRQKMKCDGPSQIPCRGCRQSGQPCVFEARSRPKSISAIPRQQHAYTSSLGGRPPTPSSTSGFYPSGPQPAPPITSRPPPPGQDAYPFRQSQTSMREPMPPPPVGMPQQPPYSSMIHSPRNNPTIIHPPPTPYYNPPPLQLAPLQSSGNLQAPRPTSPQSQDSRLRNVENTLRTFQSIPSTLSHLQTAITSLQRSQDQFASTLAASIGGPSGVHYRREVRSRETIFDLPETTWDSYRSRAWPLTPWLVGLRENQGLSGAVVNYVGKRAAVDRSEGSRRECDEASHTVSAEIGRLMADRVEWIREEIRALEVFATWSSDTALTSLAIGLARRSGLDRVHTTRKSHDDWREWIYGTIMDQMSQIPDYNPPNTHDSLSLAWKERLQANGASDPATRDRDFKLLAWLEYAETLAEVFHAQQTARFSGTTTPTELETIAEETPERRGGSGGSGSVAGDDTLQGERRKVMDPWRTFATKWDAWANGWSARSDPILSLHFNYAILFTASPVFLASSTIWSEMTQAHEGYQQLERARDAAFAVIQAVCSPEINRTLPYSFGLYRPLLGLAIHHLVSLCTALPHSPIISLPHVQTVLRSVYEALSTAQPLDIPPQTGLSYARSGAAMSPSRSRKPLINVEGLVTSSTPGAGVMASLLVEMVEGGAVAIVGKREFVGVEPSRDLWCKISG